MMNGNGKNGITTQEQTWMSGLAQSLASVSEYAFRLSKKAPIYAFRWWCKGLAIGLDLSAMMLREQVNPTVATSPPPDLDSFTTVVKTQIDLQRTMAMAWIAEAEQEMDVGELLAQDE